MEEKAKKRTRKIGFLRKRRIHCKGGKNGDNRSITTNQNINELQ